MRIAPWNSAPILSIGLWALLAPQAAFAAVDPEVQVMLDTLWVVICGILVFFMNAGFGLLETGLQQAKPCIHEEHQNTADDHPKRV